MSFLELYYLHHNFNPVYYDKHISGFFKCSGIENLLISIEWINYLLCPSNFFNFQKFLSSEIDLIENPSNSVNFLSKKWPLFWTFSCTRSWILSLNMKLTVLEDYLELGKTLEIWCRSGNKLLFFRVQNLKFHVSNLKIHVRFIKIQLSPISPESIQNLDTKGEKLIVLTS